MSSTAETKRVIVKSSNQRSFARLALVAVGIALGSAGIAVAAGQMIGEGGVIHACYRVADDDRKGDLRVVSDPASCRTGEAPLNWNQTGPPGPKGDPGEPGAAALVARVRGSGTLRGNGWGGFSGEVALTGNTWTQIAGELDQVVPVAVTIRSSHAVPACSVDGQAYVGFDGRNFWGDIPAVAVDGQPHTVHLRDPSAGERIGYLAAPASPTARALEGASVSLGGRSGCDGPVPTFTVENFSVEVIGFR